MIHTNTRIEPGDSIDIDEYISELRDEGYDADYENLWADTSGFLAEITVNGNVHAFVEADPVMQMVKEVRQPVDACTNTSQDG